MGRAAQAKVVAIRTRKRESRSMASDKSGVFLARVLGTNADGQTLVRLPKNKTGAVVPARCLATVDASPGSEVALTFPDPNSEVPLILGVVRPVSGNVSTLRISSEGQRLILAADNELELRVGQASVTLTRTGKVLIRGTYVVSQSTGVNRVRGAAVHLN